MNKYIVTYRCSENPKHTNYKVEFNAKDVKEAVELFNSKVASHCMGYHTIIKVKLVKE